ncbi:unnamed protein product, partial [Iphiclides podalirius]
MNTRCGDGYLAETQRDMHGIGARAAPRYTRPRGSCVTKTDAQVAGDITCVPSERALIKIASGKRGRTAV